MQYPLIKDGLVVNIVELDETTLQVSKDGYKELEARERATYDSDLAAWRKEISDHQGAVAEAEQRLALASSSCDKVKRAASAAKNGGVLDGVDHLDRVLVADAEVTAWRDKVANMKSRRFRARPTLCRTPAWIVPEGFIVGPMGGNIGDRWDGEKYIRPELTKAGERVEA